MKRWMFSSLLALVLALILVPVSAEAALVDSGSCGENVTWELTDEGTLTISGTGEMLATPWQEHRQEIKAVVIEDGVTSIATSAFYGCSNLTDVSIPNSVSTIGSQAFSYCTGLKEITVPETVTVIYDGTFANCTSLAKVTLPDTVTDIQYRAFESCTSLKEISLPASMTTSGGYSFGYCSSLTSVELPDGLTMINFCMFKDCTALTSVTIPESVTEISSSAFAGCTALPGIDLPDSELVLGQCAFKDCDSLVSVTIPGTLNVSGQSQASGLFEGCDSLKTVVIEDGVPLLFQSMFENCPNLVSVTLPETLEQISANAFCDCTSLTNITIPSAVTIIGDWAFYNCGNLTSVSIPADMDAMGGLAFYGCSGITEVTLEGGAPAYIKDHGSGSSVWGKPYTGEVFGDSTATVYYPADDTTWTEELRQQMGHNLVWVPYGEDEVHTHSFGNWETVTPATCTEDGVQTRSCGCGETQTEAIPAAGHTLVNDPVVSPTCTEDGLTSGQHCQVCEEVTVEQQVITAAGHIYVFWYESTAPTCTEDGEERRDCIACDHYETRTAEARGHLPGIPTFTWSEDNTDCTVEVDCLRCGEAQTLNASVTSETTPATATEDGKIVYTVTLEIGGQTYTDSITVPIPATGETVLLGDVNSDSRINFKDAILILQYASGRITAEELNLEAADVSGDGRYNFKDAILILQYASGRIEHFPV